MYKREYTVSETTNIMKKLLSGSEWKYGNWYFRVETQEEKGSQRFLWQKWQKYLCQKYAVLNKES